jgi:hypothetical protein
MQLRLVTCVVVVLGVIAGDTAGARATSYPEDVGGVTPVVRRAFAGLKRCYERSLETKPTLEGKLQIALTIAPDGRVSEAHVASTTVDDGALPACILGVLRKLRFGPDPSGENRSAIVPFRFGPSR